MKLVARALSALALLAFATPALPCGDHAAKTTTASAEKEKGSSTVAKSDKKAAKKAKNAEQSKTATATN